MASTFKTFLNGDIVPVKSLLFEAVPISGSIISGTYADLNVKNFSHQLFQKIYDYPYLSSSANNIFDLTVGYSSDSAMSGAGSTLNRQKINIYNQMAQVLMGHDQTGSILQFDEDGDLTGGTKMKECIFMTFSRLTTKDEIKKGSFNLQLGAMDQYSAPSPFQTLLTITDLGSQTNFRVNSPVGEYGILSASVGGAYSASYGATQLNGNCGLIFYQAGIAVLTGSIFMNTTASNGKLRVSAAMDSNGSTFNGMLTGSITGACDAFRHRIYNLSFNNTTELNSTIHFCRINNSDYNYSSNPSYLSGSKIVVKNSSLDAPVAYITTIGLFSSDNELLAVGKVSEPLRKDPTNELTIRGRLDYGVLPWILGLGTMYGICSDYFHNLFSLIC